jgi:hypothetical protein
MSESVGPALGEELLVTLRRDWKSCGFFRLSSIRGRRRNADWLRLSAYRSGGRKARNERIHSCSLIPGRCRSCFRALHKGKNGPQLVVGILESRNTRLFRGSRLGNVPTRLEAFPALFFWSTTLPKAVEWLPVPSLCKKADTVANAVTFLHIALRDATRTLFSSQSTPLLFFLSEQHVEMLPARVEANITLPHGLKSCGLRWALARYVSFILSFDPFAPESRSRAKSGSSAEEINSYHRHILLKHLQHQKPLSRLRSLQEVRLGSLQKSIRALPGCSTGSFLREIQAHTERTRKIAIRNANSGVAGWDAS